eukprot:g14154.t1
MGFEDDDLNHTRSVLMQRRNRILFHTQFAASFVSSFPQQSKDGRKASSFGKKRKVEGDVKGQEHVAVLVLTRKAYEGAVKNMREALKEA